MTIQEQFDYIDLYNLYDQSYTKAGRAIGVSPQTFRNKYLKQMSDNAIIKDYEDVNTALCQKNQRLSDTNRVERKTWREQTRIVNALVEVDKELVEVLSKHKIKFRKAKEPKEGKAFGILQLSDLHLNERTDFSFGKYNWEIASKRLQKHVVESVRRFKSEGVHKVLIAMTGDMLNSDRRTDELLTNATNRANALFLASKLLLQVVEHLSYEGFDVTVSYVTGNESRIGEEIGITEITSSDNFDAMIFNLIKELCRDENIKFTNNHNITENIVSFENTNILMLHGHLGMSKSKKTTAAHLYMAKYSEIGTKIDYIIFGHIHQASITETYGRSGSLTGNNEYNINALNLYGKASQNCYIIKGKEVSGSVNILEDTEGYEGYAIDKDLESYNVKSKDKYKEAKTIISIVC